MHDPTGDIFRPRLLGRGHRRRCRLVSGRGSRDPMSPMGMPVESSFALINGLRSRIGDHAAVDAAEIWEATSLATTCAEPGDDGHGGSHRTTLDFMRLPGGTGFRRSPGIPRFKLLSCIITLERDLRGALQLCVMKIGIRLPHLRWAGGLVPRRRGYFQKFPCARGSPVCAILGVWR